VHLVDFYALEEGVEWMRLPLGPVGEEVAVGSGGYEVDPEGPDA
jgi:hypothetical protein